MAKRQSTPESAPTSKRSASFPGAGRRRKPVTVALAVEANRWIRDEALRRGWQLLNLRYCDFRLPPGIVPQGALVNLLPGDPHLEALRRLGCIAVRLGAYTHPDDAALPVVLPDYITEGRLAAAHFAERGFEHVGYWGSNPWSDARVAYDAFDVAVRDFGMKLHLYRFSALDEDEPFVQRHMRKEREFVAWLRKMPSPLGFLASSDELAIRFCNWAMHAGIRIPDDLAVLGRGNALVICESSIPTITSFDLDEEGRTRVACELLARLMAGEAAPAEPVRIPPKGIIERESTHVLATSDRVVAAALRYMWDHLDSNLSVDEVADAVGISGRQLGRHFQQALGRTINEELRRKRMEEARRLLRTTDHAIADIVPLVGFASVPYFHRAFLRAFGTTPYKYRREARALAAGA